MDMTCNQFYILQDLMVELRYKYGRFINVINVFLCQMFIFVFYSTNMQYNIVIRLLLYTWTQSVCAFVTNNIITYWI